MLKPSRLSLYALIAVCSVIEATLSLADRGLIGSVNLRQVAYHSGAFWPGLLGSWKPNYTAQPYTMFLTYVFLHGGLIHLSVNMITLWSLGRVVISRIGQSNFIILYVGTGLCGAVGFAVMTSGLRPMVGASGSLFGLFGAILAWNYVDRHNNLEGLQDVTLAILLLLGLNVLQWFATGGQLAWQTHLGGFLGGWVGALLINHKRIQSR